MKVTILGMGSIGSLLCHYFIANNIEVCVAPTKHFPANTNMTYTFSFSELNGKTVLHKTPMATNQYLAETDILICALKSYHCCSGIAEVLGRISQTCTILLTNNGLGVAEELQDKLEITNPVYAMLITMAAKRLTSRHTIHTGNGSNQLGAIQNSNQSNGNALFKTLNKAIPDVIISDDITKSQWTKLAVNSVINPLTAIENVLNGELTQAKYQNTINVLIDEFIAVADACNILFKHDELKHLISTVMTNTAKNSSSMREDVLAKRKTEVDYISGFIERMGRTHNIATPAHSLLLQKVKAL